MLSLSCIFIYIHIHYVGLLREELCSDFRWCLQHPGTSHGDLDLRTFVRNLVGVYRDLFRESIPLRAGCPLTHDAVLSNGSFQQSTPLM